MSDGAVDPACHEPRRRERAAGACRSPRRPGLGGATAELGAVAVTIAADDAAAKGPNSLAPSPSVIAHVFGLVAVLGLVGGTLSACTSAELQAVVADGQLVCAVGSSAVALADQQGAPVLAKGAPKAFVDAACATIDGVAVSPPGTPIPTIKITPPTITVPLGAAQ